MAKLYKGNLSGENQYSVIYSNMRGVDFSGDGSSISRNRFSYLENMYRDYEGDGDGVTESIPGFRKLLELGGKINGIYSLKTNNNTDIIVHSGEKLYASPLSAINVALAPNEIATNLADKRSRGFELAGRLYILDGETITVVKKRKCYKVGENDLFCKIPTTYINGRAFEQRNLLTRSFCEKFSIAAAEECAHETEGLKYSIIDEDKRLCAVASFDKEYAGEVYIPSYTTIGDTRYRVAEVKDKALMDCKSITRLYVSEGVSRLGIQAFSGCTSLVEAILPNSVSNIDNACFDGCSAMETIHFGASLSRIGYSSFAFCGTLSSITYAKGESDLENIENIDGIGTTPVTYNVSHPELLITIPVYSPAASIDSVLMNGSEVNYTVMTKNGIVRSVSILLENRAVAVGADFTLGGKLSELSEDYKEHGGFLASAFAKEGESAASIIFGCRICESYDGRIFLSGNPLYPNTVFYSSRLDGSADGKLSFGDFDYFCDGIGSFGVLAMLSTGSGLTVFKEGDDGGGSIYYHTPKETGDNLVPVIYPVNYIHSGTCTLGAVCSFLDDPVFISEHGVTALDKQTINLERSIAIRSHNINPKLLSEDLKNARLAVWRGYLVLAVGGHIYLADSRATFTHETGNKEYEWYYLSGIGTYPGQKTVYRYASKPKLGFPVHPELADQPVPAENKVWMMSTTSGLVYYTFIGSDSYAAYPTTEMQGGTFSPLCEIFVLGERLFFGTECGDVCVFNNDKRGIPPSSLSSDPEFDAEEYKRLYGRQIHPSYYSFDKRPVVYSLRTALDDCGFPHMLKSSVKKSLIVKCKSFTAGELVCEVGTDKSGYREICKFPAASLSFADFNFETPTLSVGDSITVSIGEKEKGWLEKQISLYSNAYQSPIGIDKIAYRFKIAGRLKSNYN